MKSGWTIKNIFTCYQALLFMLALESVFIFMQVKKYSLVSIISEIWMASTSASRNPGMFGQLPALFTSVLTYVVLTVCIYAGVLSMYRKIVQNDTAGMQDFVSGMESGWKPVLIAMVCISPSFGILKELFVTYIMTLSSQNSSFVSFLLMVIAQTAGYFYTALVIYCVLILLENGTGLQGIKCLFTGIMKFICSADALKVFFIMLLPGAINLWIEWSKYNYMLNVSGSSNLFSVLDKASTKSMPFWLSLIEWPVNTVITVFVLYIACSVFYQRNPKPDQVSERVSH